MIRFLAILILLSGCATQTVQIPRAPAWQQPQDASPLTAYQVIAAISAVAPRAQIANGDSIYTRVSYPWLDAFTSWTWQAAKADGISYTPESFDCENFASLYREIVALKASRAGVKAAPLVAVLTVDLGPRGLHALIGVGTDRGIYIVEPQPDAGPFRITPLEKYQYRILAVKL